MKKGLVLTALLALTFLQTQAQNISKYYVSRQQTEGTLYFIEPMELFSARGEGKIIIDFTKHSTEDFYTLNFTYTGKNVAEIGMLYLEYGNHRISPVVEKVYIQPDGKKKWKHRYRIQVPAKDVESAFSGDIDTRFEIYSNGTPKTYYPGPKWKKNTAILQKIFYVIDLN